MAKIKTIRPLQHEALATSIFELLADPKKFTAMMKEFKDSRESLNDLIGKYAKVKDIERLESDAKTALRVAENNAEKILAGAEESVEKDRKSISTSQKKVGEREKKCSERESAVAAAIADGEESIAKATKDLATREKGLEKREDAVAKVAGEAGALRAEYLERVNKMRSAMGDKPIDEGKAPKPPAVP